MSKHRFSSLDGLRGVCAFVVLLFHTRHLVSPGFFAHGYVSVDVFFILSGFVLTFAYGESFARGMAASAFMRARIRRLAPMIWAGTILGALCALGVFYARDLLTASSVFLTFALAAKNAFLLPSGATFGTAYPLNSVMWSLLAELLVNAAFAFTFAWLRPRTLVAIAAAGWAFLIAYVLAHGDANFGNTLETLPFGILRAVPSFAAGVLLFKWWKAGTLAKLPSIHPLILCGLWTALCALGVGNFPAVFDLVLIVVVAPVFVALTVRYEGNLPAWLIWMGRISYPLYATHLAVIGTAHHLELKPSWAGICALIGLALLIADILARWVEPATQKWLASVSRRSTAHPTPA